MAFLLTTLLAAAFGGDDFFLASPGGPYGTTGLLSRHDAAYISQLGGPTSMRLRRRSAAGCWHGIQRLADSATTAGSQAGRNTVALLQHSARVTHDQLRAATDAWPAAQQTAVAELTAVGVRLSDAAERAWHAARRDVAGAATMAQTVTAAASREARRLLTDPAAKWTSKRRCAYAILHYIMQTNSSAITTGHDHLLRILTSICSCIRGHRTCWMVLCLVLLAHVTHAQRCLVLA